MFKTACPKQADQIGGPHVRILTLLTTTRATAMCRQRRSLRQPLIVANRLYRAVQEVEEDAEIASLLDEVCDLGDSPREVHR